MRSLAYALLALIAGPALAQPLPTYPQPRVTLDIELPAAPAYQLYGRGAPGRLAVGADGTHYVLTNSFRPSDNPLRPALDARIELSAFHRDGSLRYRTLLPVDHRLSPNGFEIESLGVAPLPSGEAAVFLGSRNEAVGQAILGRPLTFYYGIGTTGSVLRAVPVPPPTAGNDSGATYSTRFYLPTADNGLLVGGGYGGGPFAWWIGKFAPDGRRLWQAGPVTGAPEDVYALATRPDGSIVAVVEEVGEGSGLSSWYIVRLGADGRPLGRTRFDAEGNTFAILPATYVSAISAYQSIRRPELVRLDEAGRVTGRASWGYEATRVMIPDGDGIAAIVCYRVDGPPCYVVRAGLDGKVRWQSPPVAASDIARTPDGQIAALVWTAGGTRARLQRFADPR